MTGTVKERGAQVVGWGTSWAGHKAAQNWAGFMAGLPCEIELLLFAAVASFSVVTSGSQEAYIRYQVSPETHMALRWAMMQISVLFISFPWE